MNRRVVSRNAEKLMRKVGDQTVLIVEPDTDARARLRAVLEGDGYSVIAATDGDDALSIVEHARIALVVTELYLPNRKSSCLLNALCGPSPYRRTRVLAYTQHGRDRDRAWALASGADGYVLKKNGAARLLHVTGRLSRPPHEKA